MLWLGHRCGMSAMSLRIIRVALVRSLEERNGFKMRPFKEDAIFFRLERHVFAFIRY